MMYSASPAVTVVIPAYNACGTLSETVASVQAQTFTNLEIIIVDDGSHDETAELAEALQRDDNRIRVISTANGGVASARNVGIKAAQAEIVAPLDADDIWHPLKLERQVAALRSCPDVSLAYTSRRDIDERSLVLKTNTHATVSGWASHQLTAFNAVGNGSALAFRKGDALRLGGYDRRLREMGVQGCEDFIFQIRLAAIGRVVADPLYLVGYRKHRGAMSSDDSVMIRGRLKALEIVAADLPDVAPTVWETYRKFQFLLGIKSLMRKDLRQAAELLRDWMAHANPSSIRDAIGFLVHRQQTRDPIYPVVDDGRRPFVSFAPDEDDNGELTGHMRRLVARAAQRDGVYADAPSVTTG